MGPFFLPMACAAGIAYPSYFSLTQIFIHISIIF